MNTRDEIIMQEIADKTLRFGLVLGYYNWDNNNLDFHIPKGAMFLRAKPHLSSSSCHYDDNFNVICPPIVTADMGEGYFEFLRENRVHRIKQVHLKIDFDKWTKGIKIIGHPIYPHHLDIRAYKVGITFNMRGDFIWFTRLSQVLETLDRDLSQDYLGQSEETKEAIFRLVNEVKGIEK